MSIIKLSDTKLKANVTDNSAVWLTTWDTPSVGNCIIINCILHSLKLSWLMYFLLKIIFLIVKPGFKIKTDEKNKCKYMLKCAFQYFKEVNGMAVLKGYLNHSRELV